LTTCWWFRKFFIKESDAIELQCSGEENAFIEKRKEKGRKD